MNKKINLSKFRTVEKGRIEFISPKKHRGIYVCDTKIIMENRKVVVLRLKKLTSKTMTFEILDNRY